MKETQLSRINNFIEQLSSSQSHSDGVLLLDGEMEQVGDCTNTGIACMYCTNNGDCTNTQPSSL